MTSIKNKIWFENHVSLNLVQAIAEATNLSLVAAKILLNRGISLEEVGNFFDNKLKNTIPSNPYLIKDMEAAVTITQDVIMQQKRICVMGDYDVDGMCSIALLFKYFAHNDIQVSYYLPNRFQDGYGGSLNSVDEIIQNNPDLIIMVDNGSSSYELIQEFVNRNIRIVVIDHHAIETNMPQAHAIINPARLDDNSGLAYLCSAGLVFLFIAVLHKRLLNNKLIVGADSNAFLFSLLDLVALATVCDMVPLRPLNRAYIKQGLKVLAKKNHQGLKCLLEVMRYEGTINSDTLGFTLGPAINAASRMGKEHLALKLLITENESEALELAHLLKDCNLKRQEEEDVMINNALCQLAQQEYDTEFIFLGSQEWSQGIVGLIAGRIKDLHNKPTCIYSINNNNIATASGRSVNHINLGNIVIAARQQGLLVKGGGHSQAVGFSFDINLKEEIFSFFNKNIRLQAQKAHSANQMLVDYSLALSAVNAELLQQIALLEPFGIAFEEPVFRIPSVFIKDVKVIGKNKNHLTFNVCDGIRKAKGVCFKALPSELGEYILNIPKAPVDVIAKVKSNFYKGNIYPNLMVIDIKPCK